jgi:hypothetical protein
MIRTTGRRLAAANERLKSLTDVVQVSALIVQSAATRRNTEALASIAAYINELKVWEGKVERVLNNQAWISSWARSGLVWTIVVCFLLISNFQNFQAIHALIKWSVGSGQ